MRARATSGLLPERVRSMRARTRADSMTQHPFRRLLKHAGILLSGGVIGAGLAFLSNLLAARYLGAGALGRIVLVQSLVLAIDRLVNFQSWRTVIKYGADARESGTEGAFEAVLKFGTLLDMASALTGAVLAVAATFPAAHLLGWDEATHRMAMVYGGLITLNLAGTPTAVLRMNDRFGVFVWQRALAGSTKLVGVVAAWVLDAGPLAVLGAWMLGDLVAWLSIMIPAWFELRRQGQQGFLATSLAGLRRRHPGIVRFALVTNAATAIRMASKQIDDFLVGALLSEAAVGLYKVAKQFAMLIGLAQDPLTHAAYPDMTRQVAANDRPAFRRGLVYSARIAAALAVPYWLLFAVAGGFILRLTVGPEFVDARGVLLWYTGAHAIGLIGFFLPPSTMALGRPQASLAAISAATVVYFAAIVPLVRAFELAGAGIAYVVFYVVWATMMAVSLRTAMRDWSAG